MDEIRVGRWLTMPKRHPFAEPLRASYTFPNPRYENAVRNGEDLDGIPSQIEAWKEKGDLIYLPRAAAHGLDVPVVDDTSLGEAADIRSRITPRPYQEEWIHGFHQHLTTPGVFGGTGKASAGYGKTICSLELISLLGRKTIILVHKEFLMTQWAERILGSREAAKRLRLPLSALVKSGEEPVPPMLDLDPSHVGFIQQDTFEWDRPVVIAMYQTLNSRRYPKEFYESFGVVVVDETHRASAPTFHRAITKFPARYRFGVTATPRRKDGLEGIFFGHIGDICVEGESPRESPRVYQISTPVIRTPKMASYLKRFNNKYTPTVSLLVKHEARNRQIVHYLVRAASAGRKILILSDRRKHLETLEEFFREACQNGELPITWSYYVGGMDLAARKRAEGAQVLGATYQMAGEGLDIPALDTVFLVTPRGPDMIEQFVGRVLRLYDDKLKPVVMDFVDEQFEMCARMANRRRAEYHRLGWKK